MTPQERLKTIVDYLYTQKYLKPYQVHVRIVDREVRLEFKGIASEHMTKLRKDLDDREQTHIRIINVDKKKRRKKKKRSGNNRPLDTSST